MEVIYTKEFHIDEPTAVAMGKFDSLHLGHKVILDRMKREAECSLRTVVVSFVPGPEVFFGRYHGGFVLTDEEKRQLLEDAGIDYYILYPFDEKTADTDAETFLKEVLLRQMKMQVLVAGEDLSFGSGGKGNTDFIKEKSKEFNFKFCECRKLCMGEEEISATLVRNTLIKGEMEKCSALLGREYRISGDVQPGKQLGRTIGVPTCNIITEKNKLLPPKGVYFTKVIIENKVFYGVTNVGTKPTVSTDGQVGIETHVLDFHEDVYHKRIHLDFLHYERPEQKFDSLDDLREQLQKDIHSAKEYFGI